MEEVARPTATPAVGGKAVAGGSTRTMARPNILAAVAGVEGIEAVAVGTTSANRGTATAAVTEAEAVGISKVRSKIIWAFPSLYGDLRYMQLLSCAVSRWRLEVA